MIARNQPRNEPGRIPRFIRCLLNSFGKSKVAFRIDELDDLGEESADVLFRAARKHLADVFTKDQSIGGKLNRLVIRASRIGHQNRSRAKQSENVGFQRRPDRNHIVI